MSMAGMRTSISLRKDEAKLVRISNLTKKERHHKGDKYGKEAGYSFLRCKNEDIFALKIHRKRGLFCGEYANQHPKAQSALGLDRISNLSKKREASQG